MYNKDDLLDSYFMANDYKETDIETATKNINVFIEMSLQKCLYRKYYVTV